MHVLFHIEWVCMTRSIHIADRLHIDFVLMAYNRYMLFGLLKIRICVTALCKITGAENQKEKYEF